MNAVTERDRRMTRETGERERNFVLPLANISAHEQEYVVELEMPGVDQSGLEVTVEGDELTIVGRRKPDLANGDLCYCESAQADYRRVFEIGPDVDASRITARMNQGVLTLRMPKSEKAKPRRIEIKPG